jgi:hypothetical protein
MLSVFLRREKQDRFLKDKTHKTLTRKDLLGISLSVAEVTAFETSEGIGEQSGDILGESNAERFVVAMTPLAAAERLARERSKGFF